MKRAMRKTAPKVRGGVVQKKNRTALTPTVFNTPQDMPAIMRERPGEGFKHLLLRRDIEQFIRLLPDWAELSQGLNAIVLATYEDDTMGWWEPGIVRICAWNREMWIEHWDEFVAEHQDIYERLGIETERAPDGCTWVKYTEGTAKAFQLLHIFLHELGHHHDHMTTRSKRDAARGEPYAEAYARKYEAIIFDRYQEVFGPLG